MKKLLLALVLISSGSVFAKACNRCPDAPCGESKPSTCKPFGCPEDECRTCGNCKTKNNHKA